MQAQLPDDNATMANFYLIRNAAKDEQEVVIDKEARRARIHLADPVLAQ